MKNKIIVHKFSLGAFDVNNYLIYREGASRAILIDAGEDPFPILQKLEALQLELAYLINTHGHGDRIAGNREILERTGAQLFIHEKDAPYLTDPQLNLSAFLGMELTSPPPDRLLQEGDTVELDGLQLSVRHTPGHTPGHIVLVTNHQAFVGDVIFAGSIGRTDLPQGSMNQLIDSIRQKIYTLPDDTVLYPGHGPNTTVGQEKRTNPFVNG